MPEIDFSRIIKESKEQQRNRQMKKQFQVGQTYTAQALNNDSVTYKMTVTKRTAKFVTFTFQNQTVRRKIENYVQAYETVSVANGFGAPSFEAA